jgi:hypothetical protein
MRKKAKSKTKAKGKATKSRKRARTKDLGAKKAGTVKGGLMLANPNPLAIKIAYKTPDTVLTNPAAYKVQ